MPNPIGKGIFKFSLKVTTTKAKHYFLCFLPRYLSTNEIKKLTTAPIVAKTTVLITSSEFKLGRMLKKVPPAVPAKVELVGWLMIFLGQLADSRDHTSCNR